jgi:hypothetical protein
VLNNLLTNNYNMHLVLQNILPSLNISEQIILNFTQEDNGPSNIDAEMHPMGNVQGIPKYQISLNLGALNGAGQEYIAITILHEVLHVYFAEANLSMDDHAVMAQYYINPLAQSMVSIYGMSLSDATALAWGGLYLTNSWHGLSSSQKAQYITTNNYWKNLNNPRNSAPGTPCN